MKQLDRRDFWPPPILSPTRKGSLPLTWWAIDLVTHMGDPPYMIVAVDPFSKWVEAGELPDRRSATIAAWVHREIVCRYGVPALIRTDRGTEFAGEFAKYLSDLGIYHALILP